MLMIADVGNASLCNGTRLQWYQLHSLKTQHVQQLTLSI